MMEYKEWLQNRADEIAEEKYGKDFYDLPDDLQYAVYTAAEDDYRGMAADRADAMLDETKERGLR